MSMYIINVEKYKCGELCDIYPIAFETKKQARNYARKHHNNSAVTKVTREWCEVNRPYVFVTGQRRTTSFVMWEHYIW